MTNLILLLPEIALTLTFCSVLMSSVFYNGEKVRFEFWICFFGLLIAAAQTLLAQRLGISSAFSHGLSFDGLSFFSRILSIFLALMGVTVIHFSPKANKALESESLLLILALTLMCSILSISGDLLLSWIAWVVVCVCVIALQSFDKRDIRSVESGIKGWFIFFFSMILFSLFILFFSIQFQTTNIFLIHQHLSVTGLSYEASLTMFMLFFGLVGLAMGVLPSLQLSADMMEGAPTAASGLIQSFLKLAGVILFLRVGLTLFSQPDLAVGKMQVFGKFNWVEWCNLIAAASFASSSLLAARQKSLKRALGYLLASESAFLIMGISIQDFAGVSATFYQYVLMTVSLIGATFVLDQLEVETGSDQFEKFKDIKTGSGAERIALIVFLLTLVGIPPFPGFLSKFIFLSQTLQHSNYLLSATAVFATLLNGITVLKISQFVFTSGLSESTSQLPKHRSAILALLGASIVVLGIFTESILSWLNGSLHYILW